MMNAFRRGGHANFPVAVFTALRVGFWRDRSDGLPWCAAAGLGLLTHQLLPGKWYIITGGMVIALVRSPARSMVRIASHRPIGPYALPSDPYLPFRRPALDSFR